MFKQNLNTDVDDANYELLCEWKIWSGSNNRVYTYFTGPFLKPTKAYDQKPDLFFWGGGLK